MKTIYLAERFKLRVLIDFKRIADFDKALSRAGYISTMQKTANDDYLFLIDVTAETATKVVKLHNVYR